MQENSDESHPEYNHPEYNHPEHNHANFNYKVVRQFAIMTIVWGIELGPEFWTT
jgi:hypothetical protein